MVHSGRPSVNANKKTHPTRNGWILRDGKDPSNVRGRPEETLLVEGIREKRLDVSHGCKTRARNELLIPGTARVHAG